MSFERIETPKVRLYNLTLGFLKSFDMSVDQTAGSLVAAISDDPAALVELVGKDRLIGIAQEYAQRLYDEDIRGGGIGLRPANKTGGDAAADETGQETIDTQKSLARSSAPPSQTPAEKPVGGGQMLVDPHRSSASPTSPAAAKRVTVSEYPQPVRKPEPVNVTWSPANISEQRAKPPSFNKPAVSPETLRRITVRHAKAYLDNITCNGRPLGKLTAMEALSWAESVDRMEDDKIVKSEKIIALEKQNIVASRQRKIEVQVVKALATGLPPTQNIDKFYDDHPAEYQKRIDGLRATA